MGGAAKAVDMQERADKMYTATMLLGRRTDTGDVTGETLERRLFPADIGLDAVAAVLPRYTGTRSRCPHVLRRESKRTTAVQGGPRGEDRGAHAAPRHAAQHYAGGQPRTQRVYFKYPLRKGTYVRVLLEDIGRALACPPHGGAAPHGVRGPYTLGNGVYAGCSLARAREAGTLEKPAAERGKRFHLPARRGSERGDAPPPAERCAYLPVPRPGTGRYRALCAGEFLGVCRVEKHILTVEKLFCERA